MFIKKISKNIFFIFYIVLIPITLQIFLSLKNGNDLSWIVDRYCESDTVREAQGYTENSFFTNSGLPDPVYGNRFPKDGKKSWVKLNSLPYTHYPQGPAVMLALSMKILRTENLAYLRMVPILLSSFALFFLSYAILKSLGPKQGLFFMITLLSLPMFTNMMHSLSYESYTLALLCLEWALLMNAAVTTPGWVFLLIGFLQGWLSFDYFFLVCLAPLPFWALDGKPSFLRAVGYLLMGFCLAHGLHFLEVIQFHGNFKAALIDLGGAAKYRRLGWPEEFSPGYLSLGNTAHKFWTSFLPHQKHFGNLLYLFAVVHLVLLFCRSERVLLSVLSAFFIASLWILVMRQHAIIHKGFIPRHFIFYYFWVVWLLFHPQYFMLPRMRNNTL